MSRKQQDLFNNSYHLFLLHRTQRHFNLWLFAEVRFCMLFIFLRIDFSSRLPEIGIFLHDSPSYTHFYKFHLHIDLHILQFSLLYIHFYLTPSSIQCIFTFSFSIQTPSYPHTFFTLTIFIQIYFYMNRI